MPNYKYFLGLDLGQASDFTAIAILERAELQGDWDPVVFAWKKVIRLSLRYLERLPLGTPYPEVVERVGRLTRSGELAGNCRVIADATGVGRPVVDMLQRSGVRLTPVIITAGDTESVDKGYHRVPKKDLITCLQVLLQREQLKIAAGMALGPVLLEEMGNMRVKTTLSGREQFGAWREGQHDDLVLAVALGCWGAYEQYPNPPAGEDAYWQCAIGFPNLSRILGR